MYSLITFRRTAAMSASLLLAAVGSASARRAVGVQRFCVMGTHSLPDDVSIVLSITGKRSNARHTLEEIVFCFYSNPESEQYFK